MKSFELYEPTSVQEAVAILAKFHGKAKPLAGGSDLVSGVMKDWIQGQAMPLPDVLVDLTTIPQLRGIKFKNGEVAIGATTILSEIVESKALNEHFPLLSEAAHSVASPLIRNLATLGGNLNQRPRCWFFRGPDFHCLRKGGDTCYAASGDNRYHAIIGGGGCYMVHPSDTATALVALNAQARIAGPGGERVVPIDRYFIEPGDDVLRENVLTPGELLVEIIIPRSAAGTKQAWTKFRERQVYDFAIVSVAVAFTAESGRWKDGRIVLGGVSPVPYRATEIENQLRGKDIKKSTKQAAAMIRKIATPMEMNSHKVDLAQSLVEETILQALG